jgi:4-hydroxyphenylpyruvate dioxygenase
LTFYIEARMIAMDTKPKYRQAIASMSLGRASAHELPAKLDQAKKYGFEGIELFYEDLEYVARGIDEKVLPETLIQASHIVRRLCDDRGLEIIALQPFMHYEGLRDREWHAQRVVEMRLWLRLAKILGTDLIQIPSSFLDESTITGDRDVIVADLREIAELGMREDPTMRFAYESLAWGTYTNKWEDCWEIVHQVDMPNFGIVLDTFNIAARVYADPASPTRMTPDAETAISESMKRMVTTIDPRKIFFVQLADAERLEKPLVRGHELYDASQPARMSWSRNCRLFYGEDAQGGYLPIKEISRVILKDLGYQGWVSFELFHKYLTSPSADVPEKMASRGAASWKRLVTDLALPA